jgi:hypothetical protein
MAIGNWNSAPPKAHALTPGAVVSLDPTIASIFKDSPNEDQTINALSPGNPGEIIVIQVDTINTTTRTLTFGTYFRTTATLATGATAARRFNLTFISDGLGWSELCRTAAMA